MNQLIRGYISQHAAKKIPFRRHFMRSAVSVVLHDHPQHGIEVLLMQRPSRDGDPWSGDVCFPGGRMQQEDGSALLTAHRETEEEVGIALATQGNQLGRLSDQLTREHGRPRPMAVTPYVFAVDARPETIVTDEAPSSFWCPLDFLADHSNRQSMDWPIKAGPAKMNVKLPCYYVDDRKIWGLTLRMLDELVKVYQGDGNSQYLSDR